jgi:hypothetical protein
MRDPNWAQEAGLSICPLHSIEADQSLLGYVSVTLPTYHPSNSISFKLRFQLNTNSALVQIRLALQSTAAALHSSLHTTFTCHVAHYRTQPPKVEADNACTWIQRHVCKHMYCP